MNKVIYDSSVAAPDNTEYNNPPKGLREITEAEFSQSVLFTYTCKLMETRQVCREMDTISFIGEPADLLFLLIFWVSDDTCVALSNHHSDRIRYFAGGCNHEYWEMSAEAAREAGHEHYGRCWHVAKCIHCAQVTSYDSSD